MITDHTGRKVKIGQMINMCCMGMFEGKVVKIVEHPIMLSAKQAIPPHIVVVVQIQPQIMQNGQVTNTYIIAEPDPKDPLVIAAEAGELDDEQPRIIKPN